jgi:CHAT domain-containing protein
MSGKAHRALGQPEKAAQAFAGAVAILESLRSQPAAQEGNGRNNLLPYLSELELLIEQNKVVEAFDIAERSKVQALSDALGRNKNRITNGMSEEEQSEERRLVSGLTSVQLQLERASQSRTFDQNQRTSLQAQRQQTLLAYADLRKRLYAAHPQLKVARGELPSVKLEDLRSLTVDPQSALLEYAVTETNVYLFVISSGAAAAHTSRTKPEPVVMKAYPLNVMGSDLVGRLARFGNLLASRDEAFSQTAAELYDLLIRPAEAQLAGKTKLVIVPDGILWRLPFEALQSAENRYLIDQASLTYAPSLSALREMTKPRARSRPLGAATKTKRARLDLTAFGNPQLSKELVKRTGLAYKDEKFSPAPERELEIEKVQANYGELQRRIFTGADATEERVRFEAARGGILHVAARSILDDSSPMYSFVALAPGFSTATNEGLLQAWEVFNLNSQRRLVVFSNSSSKRDRAGEGIIALGWSWFVAGTPSLLFSRWDVQSRGVAQLMSEFHAGLKPQGKSKRTYTTAEALRQSVLTLRRSPAYRHPYYWSGFAVFGDAR